MSVLQKMIKFEKMVRQLQMSRDQLAEELLEARNEVVDLEYRIVDLSNMIIEEDNEIIDINITRSENVRLQMYINDNNETINSLKKQIASMRVSNNVLESENSRLKRDMSLINSRLDKNIINISNGDVLDAVQLSIPENEMIHGSIFSDDNTQNVKVVDENKIPFHPKIEKIRKSSNSRNLRYANDIGKGSKKRKEWISSKDDTKDIVHLAHHKLKHKYPESNTSKRRILWNESDKEEKLDDIAARIKKRRESAKEKQKPRELPDTFRKSHHKVPEKATESKSDKKLSMFGKR